MDSLENQALDFVLPHQDISYTPCGKNHTHHPQDWPLSGTISIDKCERQCRFRACKSWSQTAAALRKHVNAHIVNNKLDLKVLSASNGREPLKISAGDDIVVAETIAQQGLHQAPTLKASSYPSFDPQSPEGLGSDSGYGSTPSSVQRTAIDGDDAFQWRSEARGNAFQWLSPGKRSSPFPSPMRPAPKRNRTEGNITGGRTESTKDLHHERSQLLEDVEGPFSPQRLDTIMAKAQHLREASARGPLASSPSKEISPFTQGSPFEVSGKRARWSFVESSEQQKTGNHETSTRPFNQQSQPPPLPPKTISPKILGLEYHDPGNRSSPILSQDTGRNDSFHFLQETSAENIYGKASAPVDRGEQRHRQSITHQKFDEVSWPPHNRRRRPDWDHPLPAQTQFSNSVDVTAIEAHERRVSSIMDEIDEGLDGPLHTSLSSMPNSSDGKTQTNSADQLNADQDFDLFFEETFRTTPSLSSPQTYNVMNGRRVFQAKHQPSRTTPYSSLPDQKIAAVMRQIQSSGHSLPGLTYSERLGASARGMPREANKSCLTCPTCEKLVHSRSELKKHDLRHRKPFCCQVPGCTRTEGYSTTNDLDRHVKSKHADLENTEIKKRYRCPVPECKSKDKSWPRLDNFRSHLKRVHKMKIEDEDEVIRRAEFEDLDSNGIRANPAKPRTPAPIETRVEDDRLLDLKSLHVLADSAAYLEENWVNLFPQTKEAKGERAESGTRPLQTLRHAEDNST